MYVVATQFLTHVFDIFSKNREKQWKSKKYVFNIFSSFSTSSKKEFKFLRVFRTRSTFHALFLKLLIFLIDVDIARFQ